MIRKKFISLISGGFDSPLAVALMMKFGFKPILLSFLTSDDKVHSMKKKVINLCKKLKSSTKYNLKLYLISFDDNLTEIKQTCTRKLTCILCKRLMLRISQKIGLIEDTNIIVTGDILGEQASQTLDNLYSYNDIIKDFILLRPLIAFNKDEVIDAIRKLGLYKIISQPSAVCRFNPQYPETHARLKQVESSEKLINIKELIEKALEKAEVLIL